MDRRILWPLGAVVLAIGLAVLSSDDSITRADPAIGSGGVTAPSDAGSPEPADSSPDSEGSVEEPTDDRRLVPDMDADSSASVTDATGNSIARARVVYIAWALEHWTHGIRPTLGATAALELDSQVATTDDRGSLDRTIDVAALSRGDYGAVAWATKPGYRAAGIEVEDGDEASLTDWPIVLEEGPVGRVVVLDSAGSPAPVAKVEARAPVVPIEYGPVKGRVVHSRALFWVTADIDGDGIAVLPAGPPPVGTLADGLDVRATAPGQVSDWAFLPTGGSTRLVLRPSFEVSGTVVGFDDFFTPDMITDGVLIERRGARGWEPCAHTVVDATGHFGPVQVSFVAGAAYRVQLDSLALEPRPTTIAGAVPGASIDIDLVAAKGRWMIVAPFSSSPAGELLEGATVTASWIEGGEVVRQVGRFDIEDAERGEPGFTLIGLPQSGALTLRAEAPGHAPAERADAVMPDHDGRTLNLILEPSARLEGRVVGLSPEVEYVGLIARAVDGGALTRIDVDVDQGGAFSTDQVPAGAIVVAAVAADGTHSAPVRCEAEQPRSVELRFGELRTLTGVVVDLETRDPIPGATIAHLVELAGEPAVADVEPIVTDDLGRFELDSRHPSSTASLSLRVAAPGYRIATVSAPITAAEPRPPLEIGLDRVLGGQFVFTSSGGHDISRTSFSADGPAPIVVQWIPEDGVLAAPGLVRGAYTGRVHEVNDDRLRWVWFDVARASERIEVPIHGPGEVTVQVSGAASEVDGAVVHLSAVTGRVSQLFEVDAAGPEQVMARLPFGEWRATLYDEREEVVARGSATLTESNPHATIVLEPSAPSLEVQVLDQAGEPVAGCQVVAYLREDQARQAQGVTDADGVFGYRGAVSPEIIFDAFAPGRGMALAVPSSDAVGGRLVLELTSNAAAVVRFVDGGGPIESTTVHFTNVSRHLEFASDVLTDSAGRAMLSGLAVGTVEAEVRDPRWVPTTVRAKAGEPSIETEKRLHRRASARIFVVDAAGAPIERAQVSIRKAEFGDFDLQLYAAYYGFTSEPEGFVTGADGGLTVDGLPEGEVVVRAVGGSSEGEAVSALDPSSAARVVVVLGE